MPPGALLLVPVGSCEQHGPHLPLGTDTLIAEALAQAAVERATGSVVSPSIAIGASGEHRGFPGTLSIGTEVLVEVAVELARSALAVPADPADPASSTTAATGGFRGVLYVNAHGGNATALTRAVRTLSAEGRTVAAWHARVDGGDLHAGHTETSLMLHVRPDLVRMEDAEAGSTASLVEIEDRLRSEGVRAVSANGVLGDPHGAGPDEGAAIFGALLHSLLEVLAGMGESVQA